VYEERLYVFQDANWNVTGVRLTAGTVQERYVYSGYGGVSIMTPTWGARAATLYEWKYQFQGGRFEILSGLTHFGAREYSAELQTWIGMDPLYTSTNWYVAFVNNPVNYVDPSGLEVYLVKGTSHSGYLHYSVAWYDQCTGKGATFDGVGPGSNFFATAYVLAAYKVARLPLTMRFEPIMNLGHKTWERVTWSDEVVKTVRFSVRVEDLPGVTPAQEFVRLFDAFEKTKQIPLYQAKDGPNSNTWARQLLINAGFSPPAELKNAAGWQYGREVPGPYGYGGKFFNADGTPTPAWKSEYDRMFSLFR
jgi:RHS repeat-associated protein